MSELKVFHGACPYCGKKIDTDQARLTFVGSPVQRCKRCKNEYLDIRYREPAIMGTVTHRQTVKSSLTGCIFGLVLMIGCGSYHIYQVRHMSHYSLVMPFMAIMGGLVVISSIISIFSIMLGFEEKKAQKLMAESEQRMQNKEYVKTLYDAGYSIPVKYMEGIEIDE